MLVFNKTNGKQKCPYCSGKRVCKENSLSTLFPEIAKEWDYSKNKLTPDDYTAFSNKEVEWICPKGHEYAMPISHRTSYHQNCSCCAGRKVCDDNRLSILFPDIAKQWHPTKNGNITPHDIVIGSNTKRWWKCECGYEWKTSPKKRCIGKQGCSNCVGKILTKENCLGAKYPELIESWDYEKNYPLTPFDVFPNTTKPLYWKCKRGHDSYYMRADHRIKGHGCKFCNNQTSRLQLFLYSELKVLLDNVQYKIKVHGVECDIFLPDYKIGIEVDAFYWHKDKQDADKSKSDKLRNNGIRLINVRENGLSHISDDAVRYNKNDSGINICKALSKLLSTIIVDSRLIEYISNDKPINEAFYLQELAKFPAPLHDNKLSTLNPIVSSEWDYEKNFPLTPDDVSANSGIKAWFKCLVGHSWRATIRNRHSYHQGCPECWKIRHKNLHKTKIS